MLKNRLRSLLLGGPPAPPELQPGSVARIPQQTAGPRISAASPVAARNSNGLDQFFASIRDLGGLSVLDLAGASQANITYITSLGHRIYTEDFVRALETSFGSDDIYAAQEEPARASEFLHEVFDYPPECFDGALVWDSLQFLAPPLLHTAVDELARMLKPGAYLLAFFHADEKASSVPVYSYRINDAKTLSLSPRGSRKPAQFFNNRALEKLFYRYASVKFFLTRDSLREVLVRR